MDIARGIFIIQLFAFLLFWYAQELDELLAEKEKETDQLKKALQEHDSRPAEAAQLEIEELKALIGKFYDGG